MAKMLWKADKKPKWDVKSVSKCLLHDLAGVACSSYGNGQSDARGIKTEQNRTARPRNSNAVTLTNWTGGKEARTEIHLGLLYASTMVPGKALLVLQHRVDQFRDLP